MASAAVSFALLCESREPRPTPRRCQEWKASITEGFREGTRKIILNGYLTDWRRINRKLSPRNCPSNPVGNTPYRVIQTSPGRKISALIILASPGRFSRFGKQRVWRPYLGLLRCKPLSVRA